MITMLPFFGLTFVLLALVAVWLATRRARKREEQWLREAKEQTAKHLQELETAIEEWLLMLDLPSLAKQKKLREAVRQLRTLLIEKLLQQRILY